MFLEPTNFYAANYPKSQAIRTLEHPGVVSTMPAMTRKQEIIARLRVVACEKNCLSWTSPLAQGPVELIIPFPGKGIDKNMISFKLLLQPGNKQSQDISFQLGKNFPGLLV